MAELARRQHGVVSIRQLEALLGYTRASVQRAVEVGRLHQINHGVYAVGHTNLSKHGECLAAVLAVGPGSLLSYWSAGWLWGILSTPPRPFHVTASGPRRLRDRDPVKVHRARNLVAVDRAFVGGIPVTSLARTLLDLAEVLKPEPLAKVLEQAEKSKHFDGLELLAVCARSRQHRGSKRLLAAFGAHRPSRHRLLRSNPERDFLALIERSDLPLPATNYFFGRYELDAYWSTARLAVEIDSFWTHGSRRAFETDRERDAFLLEEGIRTLRVTDRQLERQPDQVLRRVAALLGQPEAAPR